MRPNIRPVGNIVHSLCWRDALASCQPGICRGEPCVIVGATKSATEAFVRYRSEANLKNAPKDERVDNKTRANYTAPSVVFKQISDN
jgi:hypothetical protein